MIVSARCGVVRAVEDAGPNTLARIELPLGAASSTPRRIAAPAGGRPRPAGQKPLIKNKSSKSKRRATARRLPYHKLETETTFVYPYGHNFPSCHLVTRLTTPTMTSSTARPASKRFRPITVAPFILCSRVDYKISQLAPFVKRTIFIIFMKKCLNSVKKLATIEAEEGSP